MWTAIATALGILSTVAAWYFNPRRKINSEIDKIFKELDQLYIERDKALEKNDDNILTSVVYRINVLRQRKDRLLQLK